MIPPTKGEPMKRRELLTVGAAGIAASAFPKPAISQNRLEWRMVTSWPKGLPGLGTGAEKLAEKITALSGGRLTIKVYAAGELVPALQCFDAVANGTADMAHDASYYHLQKSEACAFFTAFPMGLTADELSSWVHYGGGQALWDELYAGFGIKGFLAGNTGTQMLGWFKKEIRTLDDLKGLKFRAPGNGGRVLAKLGATVVVLPGGEIFPALQSGAIDGAEWVGPPNDMALGFHQVCKYYYSPGYHEPGAGLQLMVNKAKFDALPADLQALVATAAQASHDDMLAYYNATSGPALRSLVQDHGVQLKIMPNEVMTAMGNASNEILMEIMEKDAITKKIAESYLKFRGQVIPWTRVGEQQYLQARMLPYTYGRPK